MAFQKSAQPDFAKELLGASNLHCMRAVRLCRSFCVGVVMGAVVIPAGAAKGGATT